MEAREAYLNEQPGAIPGVETQDWQADGGIHINAVKIINQEGVKALGKPIGTYVTLETRIIPPDIQQQKAASQALAAELIKLVGKVEKTLVVGLGNRYVTADALGPKTVENTLVTRHLLENLPGQVDKRVHSVCAVAPGVLGITGIETLEMVKGLVAHVKPDVVIAIDALASSSTNRLANTIKLTDTGISPGSGLGNMREGLNKETLGVPVIALGVPLVVYAQTISRDALNLLLKTLQDGKQNLDTKRLLAQMDTQADAMIDQVVTQSMGDLVVTPKEIDQVVKEVAYTVAMGINLSLHPEIQFDEMTTLID